MISTRDNENTQRSFGRRASQTRSSFVNEGGQKKTTSKDIGLHTDVHEQTCTL